MTEQIDQLKQRALDGHARNMRWRDFLAENIEAIRQAAPYDRRVFHELCAKLMHLMLTGEASGRLPPPAPWQDDDQVGQVPVISDTTTRARYPGQLFDTSQPHE